jgi:TusA-related sulfurtransferase
MVKADKTLDIQGLVHPRSRVVIEMTMTGLGPGQTLNVITNDISTKESVPSLCSYRGYTLLAADSEGGTFSYTIRK